MKHAAHPSDVAAPGRMKLAAVVLGALILGACGAGPGPELVAFTPSPTPAPTPTAVPTSTPAPPPTPTPTPEVLAVVEEPEPPPPMWAVVDSVILLNLRSEPTTSAEIVAELTPGLTGLVGTGETATADGFDWVELEAGEDHPGGWVAVNFLLAEEIATDE